MVPWSLFDSAPQGAAAGGVGIAGGPQAVSGGRERARNVHLPVVSPAARRRLKRKRDSGGRSMKEGRAAAVTLGGARDARDAGVAIENGSVRSFSVQFSSVQLLSRVRLFATPWTAAHQAFLSITNSRSLLKLMSIESVMPSSHLILSSPSPSAFNLSQDQGLFQLASFPHRVAKVLEFQLQHQSVQ